MLDAYEYIECCVRLELYDLVLCRVCSKRFNSTLCSYKIYPDFSFVQSTRRIRINYVFFRIFTDKSCKNIMHLRRIQLPMAVFSSNTFVAAAAAFYNDTFIDLKMRLTLSRSRSVYRNPHNWTDFGVLRVSQARLRRLILL